MTHALRQHCGSFLYDSIRQQWPSEEETSNEVVLPRASVMERSDKQGLSGVPVAWPLFTAPSISSLRVTKFQDKDGIMYFTVLAILEGYQWTVEKTYEDFAHLHKQLVHLYNMDRGLLPSRRMFGILGAPKQEHLLDMQTKLETMLMTAVQNFQVPPKELLKFVHYSFTDILSVTQALAAFFYSQGEVVLQKDKAVQISPLQLHCITRRMTLPLASSETGKMTDDFGHLLDFLHHLKKLKIAPPTDDPNLVKGADQLTFDLSLLKSLEVLLIESLELHQFQNRSNLPDQLVAMEVRRSLKSLKDILLVYPADVEVMLNAGSTSHHIDFAKALRWKCLKKANFKLNNIKAIDKTLSLTPSLEKLDLSYNCIEEIENLVELPHLTLADLSHNKISSLANLHTKIGNITKLGLASNNIKSLDGMEKALSLQFVDLSNNSITETSEVGHMSKLPCLEELNLSGNPIAHSPSYRSNVFGWLPITSSQVALDGKKASKDELEICASIQSPTTGHKRVPSRTPDIKPDIEDWDNIEAEDELAAGLSLTTKLEDMRREGGDRWLALLNAEKPQPVADHEDDELVTHSPKQKKRKGRKHHRHHGHRSHKKDTEKSRESSPEPFLEKSFEAEESTVLSAYLQGLIETKTTEPVESTVNFAVTLLEYEGSFDVLSSSDIDQLLVNRSLEECAVSIDSSLFRVLEVEVSASKTRCQRDLAFLRAVKVHEGRRHAVALQFLPCKGVAQWVVYCVPDPDALARLYVTLQYAVKKRSELEVYADGNRHEEMIASGEVEGLQSSFERLNRNVTVPKPGSGIEIADIAVDNSSDENSLHFPPGGPGAKNVPSGDAIPLSAISADVYEYPLKTFSDISIPVGSQFPVDSSAPVRSQSPTESGTPIRSRTPTQSGTPIRSRTPTESGTPVRSQSPTQPVFPVRSRTPTDSGTPVRSQSPTQPVSPVRSQSPTQPAPHRSDYPESDLVTSVAVGAVSATPLSSLPITRKEAVRKIIKKPGLESVDLINFFKGIIAKDQLEVLMNVLWGGCNLNSSPSCEIEVGLVLSDKAVYLLEVLDPDQHKKRRLSWASESMPLANVFYSPLVTLSKITIGIFDQTILAEFISKGVSKTFVVFPHTYEQMVAFTENLKAALDASGVPHHITTTQEAIISSEDIADSVPFLNPDRSDLQKLKESLVHPKALAQVSNFLAVTSRGQSVSFEEEAHKISEDLAEKFEIMQYVIVGEISSDSLPIANGRPHLTSRGLVLTTEAIFLCKEEIASWPGDDSSSIKPPFSRCSVLDSQPLHNLSFVKVCDKALPVVSYTDPVYEFAICFEIKVDGAKSTSSFYQWKLCVHDRQYIDQFVSCLRDRWFDLHQRDLRVESVTSSISSDVIAVPENRSEIDRSISLPTEDDTKAAPTFFKSDALVKFASNTNYQRQKYFKKHVAEAEFMKSDETLLSVFLSHCSVSTPDTVEIETCVLVSNYAIYLLSDVDNIRVWLERSGPSSFSRMSLLSRKDSSEARCFYRLWLNDIKEVQVGLFYLSAKVTASKPNESVTVHTNSATTTLSFLSALSCNLNLRNSAEEEVLSDLLSEYIDVVAESIAQKSMKVKKSSKSTAEFLQHTNEGVDKFKKLLIGISPTITRSSSIDECVASMQFLCQQVMLLVEEMRIRDSITTQAHPHLILLTNYGLYVCRNVNREVCSPSVFDSSELQPKKWCHVDLMEQVVVTDPHSSPHGLHTITIYIKTKSLSLSASQSDSGVLCLLAQNSEQTSHFLYMLSLFTGVRSSQQLSIQRAF